MQGSQDSRIFTPLVLSPCKKGENSLGEILPKVGFGKTKSHASKLTWTSPKRGTAARNGTASQRDVHAKGGTNSLRHGAVDYTQVKGFAHAPVLRRPTRTVLAPGSASRDRLSAILPYVPCFWRTQSRVATSRGFLIIRLYLKPAVCPTGEASQRGSD